MSVFGLWELKGEMFPNLYLKLLELFLLLICLSTPLRWNSDKNITFDPRCLVGEKIFFFFSVCQHFAYNLSEYSVKQNHSTKPFLLMEFNQQPKGSSFSAETPITPCL